MSNPFHVTVTKRLEELHVSVQPEPFPTDEELMAPVTKSINGIIFEYSHRPNNLMTRMGLKRKLESVLEKYYKEGIIRPITNEDRKKMKERSI